MTMHITNMTDDPLLLTVVQGKEPHERLIRISNHACIFNRKILQQQGLPTGGKDPIKIESYADGCDITLRVDAEYYTTYDAIELRSDHAVVIKIYRK